MQLLHRLRVTPHEARPGETTAAAPAFATGRYDLTLSFADNEYYYRQLTTAHEGV
jgi:hypothetical protein